MPTIKQNQKTKKQDNASPLTCKRLMDIAYNAITLLEDTSCGLGLTLGELCDELAMSREEYSSIINS